MKSKSSPFITGRRQFMTKVLPAGAFLCLGCKSLSAVPLIGPAKASSGRKPKYLEDSGMSVEDVFKFSYGYCIPTYKVLAKTIGKEKFLDMLTKANGEVYSQMFTSMTEDRSLKGLESIFENMLTTSPYDKAFKYEVVENTDKVLEIKFTECMPAKVCREMDAADIGYALECAPTDIITKAFNPKMSAENPENLMKGDSVCLFRYTLAD